MSHLSSKQTIAKMAAALMLKLGPYTVLCCIALAMISSYSTTAVYGAPTARENKLLTEGICSMRSILVSVLHYDECMQLIVYPIAAY